MKQGPLLRALFRPAVLLPVLLAAALLSVAFRLGGVEALPARIRAFPPGTFWTTLACAAVYLAVKVLQLRSLLGTLGVRIPWPNLGLAFCVGELTATLPFGLFSQNWVMSTSSRVHLGRSVAATVMMLVAELAVALTVLAVLGVPAWPWVRPLALLALAAGVVLVLGMPRYEHASRRMANGVRREGLRKALLSGIELLASLKRLSTAKLLFANTLLAATYLAALAYAFLLAGRAMGVPALDYGQAVVIYAFALATVLLGAGAFGQIGTVEVLGMVAASASGIGYADGLALMLGFRIVWTAAIWLLDLPIVVLLRQFSSTGS